MYVITLIFGGFYYRLSPQTSQTIILLSQQQHRFSSSPFGITGNHATNMPTDKRSKLPSVLPLMQVAKILGQNGQIFGAVFGARPG